MSASSKADKAATAVRMALLMEASAEKPGNVTPTRCFDALTFTQFIASSCAIGDTLHKHSRKSVGELILAAVTASMQAAGTNTHLGAILLLAPMVRTYCQTGTLTKRKLASVLSSLTKKDAQDAYRAIRAANPGGLGKAPEQDIHKKPTVTLLEAMRLGAERDWIAYEYTHDFSITLEFGAPDLAANFASSLTPSEALTQTFLGLMNRFPDSLIARKAGLEMARKAAGEAGRILKLGGMFSPRGKRAVYEFDQALRMDSNLLNPGTTADLVAAALFVYFIKRGYAALKIKKRLS